MSRLFFILLLVPLFFTGCAHKLLEGQALIDETRVLGVDLSVPVPFAQGVNVVNIRFGWIENKLYMGNKVKLRSDSLHENLDFFRGTGTIHRIFEVGYTKTPSPLPKSLR